MTGGGGGRNFSPSRTCRKRANVGQSEGVPLQITILLILAPEGKERKEEGRKGMRVQAAQILGVILLTPWFKNAFPNCRFAEYNKGLFISGQERRHMFRPMFDSEHFCHDDQLCLKKRGKFVL